MNRIVAGRAGITLCIALLVSPMARAQSGDDLRKDIEELKAGQAAIQKDLQEIKKLLQNQARPAAVADALPRGPVSVASEPTKGDGSAKVVLIEYSDYQCPFCSRFGKDTYPQLETEYIKTGKIKYVFRDLPLDFHKQAFKAAEAAHCAGEQGRFWQMHDRLFSNQQALTVEELPKHAEALGLDAAKFQQCLDSGRFATDIRKDITDAGTLGISGTPTFLIGTLNKDGTVQVARKLVGAKPYADFKAAIDEALAK